MPEGDSTSLMKPRSRGKNVDTQPLLYKDSDARKRAGGISRATLYRWTKDGIIPAPIVINGQNFRSAKEFDDALLNLGVQLQEQSA